jgi:Uma2 family endonuclease
MKAVRSTETSMSETADRKHWTWEDYLQIPDDGKRYEIVRGELIVSPSARWRHQRIAFVLAHKIELFAGPRHLGECVAASTDVVLANDSVVQPDVQFISTERLSLVAQGHVAGPPDLAIEVLSESSRNYDRVVKRQLYSDYGVLEYWVVDPAGETIAQFVRERGELVDRGLVSSGDLRSLAALPGFAVPLAEIFRTVGA